MRDHNRTPGSTHEDTHPAIPETVQFTDGELASLYNRPGDTLDLSFDSTNKHLHGLSEPHSGSMIVVQTASGNRIVIGRGVVADTNKAEARQFPPDVAEGTTVQIGEPMRIPGVLKTTPVVGVAVRLNQSTELGARGRKTGAENVFKTYGWQLGEAAEHLYQ